MMEWKTMGIAMISPTLLVALYLAWRSRKEAEFFINLAICFWIAANAYWMCCEFIHHAELKNFAGYPFMAGMVCVGLFYLKQYRLRGRNI